jgi:hypothetical protein
MLFGFNVGGVSIRISAFRGAAQALRDFVIVAGAYPPATARLLRQRIREFLPKKEVPAVRLMLIPAG